jgi:hypothetical protein
VHLRRGARNRHRRGAQVGEAPRDPLVLQRLHQRLVQPRQHRRGRGPRRIEPVPHAHLEARQPALRGRRQVGQRGNAVGRGHREAADRAGTDLLGRVGGLVAHQVDRARHQVVHRRAGAAVGHRGHARVHRLHQQQPAQVAGGADAGIGVVQRLAAAADQRHQFGQVARLDVAARDQRHRHLGHQAERLEAVDRVVGQPAVQRRDRRHADMVQQDGVAIGPRIRDTLGPQRAARTADILHHHGLAQISAHGLRDQATHRVGRPAGGEGDHHADRPGGIGALGEGARCAQRTQRRKADQGAAVQPCHVVVPPRRT